MRLEVVWPDGVVEDHGWKDANARIDLVRGEGENRSIVKRGLEEIRRAQRPGIRALLAAAKCEPTQVDEGDLAHPHVLLLGTVQVAPDLRAAGREEDHRDRVGELLSLGLGT